MCSRNAAFNSPALNFFLSSGAANEFLILLLFHLKHKQWKDEREWRIRPMVRGDQSSAPFIELPICTPELVTEVILGTRFDGDAGALEKELHDVGLGNVKVKRSSCGL